MCTVCTLSVQEVCSYFNMPLLVVYFCHNRIVCTLIVLKLYQYLYLSSYVLNSLKCLLLPCRLNVQVSIKHIWQKSQCFKYVTHKMKEKTETNRVSLNLRSKSQVWSGGGISWVASVLHRAVQEIILGGTFFQTPPPPRTHMELEPPDPQDTPAPL